MKDEPTGAGGGASVTLRPARPEDEAFLFEVYAGTRADELDALGWGDVQRQMFLRMQFGAQQRDYRARFDAGGHQIILVDSRRAGRIWVDRRDDEIRLVDIALLPRHRGAGVGTALIKELIAEAERSGKPLRHSVEKDNLRALSLYRRLGFAVTGDLGTHFKMEKR